MRSKMSTHRRQNRVFLLGVNALAFAFAFLFARATPSWAQTTTGTIRGAVTGSGGAAVSDAQVAARNVETGTSRGTTTHADGLY
ncbi:MAG TPA: carboxypeptidase-like regulatory domain-containing protein, partial [Acidimicrobiia bacterium]|nr:carboxypeptidase-like regulatory domain-containing protein [Acidimicrobiia bacterium]